MFGTQKGTVTLITLVVVITMLGISGAMFFSSNSFSMMVHEQKMTTRVFYLAETGISHGILALNNMKYPNFNSALLGPDGLTNTPDDGMIGESGMTNNGLNGTTEHGPGTKLFGGGFYRVRVFDNEDGDLNLMADSDGIIILQSIGNLGLRHKKIEIFLQADLRLQSPFSKGPLTGDEEVRVGQDSFVSAINSNLPLPLLDQIASSLFTPDGNINSNGSLEIDQNSTIQGNVTSTASVATGDIEIDQNTTILGNIFTDNGDIDIGSGSTISGNVATNNGEVDGFSTPSPEGSAQIPSNPFPEYQEQYDQLLATENGGSVSEVPSPTTPSNSGVPGANIFSNVTYSGGSRTLGVAGTSKTYYFDSLSMKSGALLNLLGNVTIIVKEKFDINNPDTRIISTGNVTFIVGEYEQHNETSLQVTGNFNLQASNSDEGDIRIDGTTTITGSASIIAEDKMEFASKSVLSI
ncbi:MAG: polymer-forming cytoskeletal protein, partial [Planctomycetota bacterium]